MIATRSPIVRIGIQAASPLAIVVGIYLLFAGHNNPGGGFAAGLVFSAVAALRTITGLTQPVRASMLISFGLATVAIVAIIPMLWGDSLLDQQVISVEIPQIGKVKSGTALLFDIGVTAIVVGLVVALLHGLTEPNPAPQLEQSEAGS